jgi:flagellar P-ring protein precursor FlgI
MTRVVTEINRTLGESVATAIDSASVDIPILPQFGHDPIMLVSRIENVEVVQDVGARVVVNEKTGTIVMGEHVRVSTVALAHGNLSIVVRNENIVSQPNALATGSTAVVQNGDVQVGEEQDRLSIVNAQVSLGEVVKALNALGATPRDLISILSALKRAGALQAELMIM